MKIHHFILLIFVLSNISLASSIKIQLYSTILDDEGIIPTFSLLETLFNLAISSNSPSDYQYLLKFAIKKFCPRLRHLNDSEESEFLSVATNSGVSFLIFLCNLYCNSSFNFSFEEIKDCYRCKHNGLLKESIYADAKTFVEFRVNRLLIKPSGEWDKQKRIIRLYINLLQTMNDFLNQNGNVGQRSTILIIEISKYEFLLDNFLNTSGNQIDFHELIKSQSSKLLRYF
jgi:hypothetical protein